MANCLKGPLYRCLRLWKQHVSGAGRTAIERTLIRRINELETETNARMEAFRSQMQHEVAHLGRMMEMLLRASGAGGLPHHGGVEGSSNRGDGRQGRGGEPDRLSARVSLLQGQGSSSPGQDADVQEASGQETVGQSVPAREGTEMADGDKDACQPLPSPRAPRIDSVASDLALGPALRNSAADPASCMAEAGKGPHESAAPQAVLTSWASSHVWTHAASLDPTQNGGRSSQPGLGISHEDDDDDDEDCYGEDVLEVFLEDNHSVQELGMPVAGGPLGPNPSTVGLSAGLSGRLLQTWA